MISFLAFLTMLSSLSLRAAIQRDSIFGNSSSREHSATESTQVHVWAIGVIIFRLLARACACHERACACCAFLVLSRTTQSPQQKFIEDWLLVSCVSVEGVNVWYCWRGSNFGSYQLLMFTAVSSSTNVNIEIIRYYQILPSLISCCPLWIKPQFHLLLQLHGRNDVFDAELHPVERISVII